MILINSLIISLVINIGMFIPAYFLKTDKLTDISYAITFVAISLYGLLSGQISTEKLILFILIFLWALRLGIYLLVRIRKIGRDKRFDGMRENFGRFIRFWLLQGTTVWLILLPSIFFFQNNIKTNSLLMYIGLIIFFIGLFVETISDIQKYRFINKSENKGKWIESGLWKYSRHPNYFGEILLWLGVYFFTLQGLNGLEIIIGLISPIYIALLIIFVSGIPMLEKAANKRWGDNPKYQEYRKRTSMLLLLPQKQNS